MPCLKSTTQGHTIMRSLAILFILTFAFVLISFNTLDKQSKASDSAFDAVDEMWDEKISQRFDDDEKRAVEWVRGEVKKGSYFCTRFSPSSMTFKRYFLSDFEERKSLKIEQIKKCEEEALNDISLQAFAHKNADLIYDVTESLKDN